MNLNGRVVDESDDTLRVLLSAVRFEPNVEAKTEEKKDSDDFIAFLRKHGDSGVVDGLTPWNHRHSELWDKFCEQNPRAREISEKSLKEYQDKGLLPKLAPKGTVVVDYNKVRKDFTEQLKPIRDAFPAGTTGSTILREITEWILLTPELAVSLDLASIGYLQQLLKNRALCIEGGFIPTSLAAPVSSELRPKLASLARRKNASALSCINAQDKYTIEQAKTRLLNNGLAGVLEDSEVICECCRISPENLNGVFSARMKQHPPR